LNSSSIKYLKKILFIFLVLIFGRVTFAQPNDNNILYKKEYFYIKFYLEFDEPIGIKKYSMTFSTECQQYEQVKNYLNGSFMCTEPKPFSKKILFFSKKQLVNNQIKKFGCYKPDSLWVDATILFWTYKAQRDYKDSAIKCRLNFLAYRNNDTFSGVYQMNSKDFLVTKGIYRL